MKPRTIIIALFIMLSAAPVVAQDNKRPRFNPEEFRAKLEAYITQKAGLTQGESEKVFPLFHEMKEKQRKLMHREQKLKHKKELESDKDYQEALDEITEIRTESAKIGATYYKRMSKAISPKKVFMVMRADDSFHREMLQKFEKQKQRQNVKQDQRQHP